jgi:ABC-2 type transport system ATP-binding protein
VIRAFRAQGRTVMLTTHYMDEAERLCDRVAVVDRGTVIALGSPAKLIAQLGGENIVSFSLEKGAQPLDETELARLPSVRSSRCDADSYSLAVEQQHLALPALLTHLQTTGRTLANLKTRHATLEDVFVSLTGRHLEEPANGQPA